MLKTLLCLLSVSFTMSAFSEEIVNTATQVSKLSLQPSLAYTQLSNSGTGQSLSGPGLELLAQYAINQKSALGVSFRQMNLGSESSGSAFNFRYIYALTGSLLKKTSKINLNSKTILNSVDAETPSWCLQAIGSQYYINTSSSTVPFTGFGLGTYYKYPFNFSTAFAGINYETMQNNSTLTSLSLLFGIDIKL